MHWPPPLSNGHSGAPIFGQNHANAWLYLDISPKNRCPKLSWQGFRHPPPNGQCPNELLYFLNGASQVFAFISEYVFQSAGSLIDLAVYTEQGFATAVHRLVMLTNFSVLQEFPDTDCLILPDFNETTIKALLEILYDPSHRYFEVLQGTSGYFEVLLCTLWFF